MTTLQSGHIQTGNNTPNGKPKQIAVDNPYITIDDFVNSFEAQGLGITTLSPSYSNGVLQSAILRASAWLNRQCNMYFDTQTIDETMTGFTVKPYNPQLVSVVLANRPYSRINSCFIQVLKWFVEVDVTSPASYIQDFYDFGYYRIVPLLSSSGQGVGSPIPAMIIDRIALGVLWTNYTFGYGTPLTSQVLTQYTPPFPPSSGIPVYDETPVGTINGINKIFTLAHSPNPSSSLQLFLNGALQHQGADYTLVNNVITFNGAPTTGSVLLAFYVY